MNNRLNLLFEAYNKKFVPLINNSASGLGFLDKLLNLYHINRYNHIINMQLMKNYNEATISYHKIDGLLTSITIHNIFDKDLARNKPEFMSETKFHSSIAENVSVEHSTATLDERDIIFIRSMIHNIAFIIKDYYFNKPQSNKATESIVDYEKANTLLDDFGKDETIEKLLNSIFPDKKSLDCIDFSEETLKEYYYCYQMIYEDLVSKPTGVRTKLYKRSLMKLTKEKYTGVSFV